MPSHSSDLVSISFVWRSLLLSPEHAKARMLQYPVLEDLLMLQSLGIKTWCFWKACQWSTQT